MDTSVGFAMWPVAPRKLHVSDFGIIRVTSRLSTTVDPRAINSIEPMNNGHDIRSTYEVCKYDSTYVRTPYLAQQSDGSLCF